MSVTLSPSPKFTAWQNGTGLPLVGGQLYTYIAGSSTPQATWVDSTQTTQNANPTILDFRGQCNLWLDPTLTYKFVLYDAAGNLYGSEDNIAGYMTATQITALITSTVTQSYIGQTLYPQSAAEIAASVTPVNYWYPPGNVLRYGADPTGAANSYTAVANAISSNAVINFPPGAYKNATGQWAITGNKFIYGTGAGFSANGVSINHAGASGPLFYVESAEFGSVVIDGFDVNGGNGTYVIISNRPQISYTHIHAEGTHGYNGGLIQLLATQSGTFDARIAHCKWVAPSTVSVNGVTTNAYYGIDITANGGNVEVDDVELIYGSVGISVQQVQTLKLSRINTNQQGLYSSDVAPYGNAGISFWGVSTITTLYKQAIEITNSYIENAYITGVLAYSSVTNLAIRDTYFDDGGQSGTQVGVNIVDNTSANITIDNCFIQNRRSGCTCINNAGQNLIVCNTELSTNIGAGGVATTIATTTSMSTQRVAYLSNNSGFAGNNTDTGHNIYDVEQGKSGSFTATLTGCTTAPTGTVNWNQTGNSVTLNIPAITATSNSTGCTLTGLPSYLEPATQNNQCAVTGQDAGAFTVLEAQVVPASGTITLAKANVIAGFTNSATTKGINASTMTYLLT